jgi:hypothetical protein
MTKRETKRRKKQLDKLELKRAHINDAMSNVKDTIKNLKSEEEWIHITNKSHVYPYAIKLSADLHQVYLTIHMLISDCKFILSKLQVEYKQVDKEYKSQLQG